jgi:hypothetical protein
MARDSIRERSLTRVRHPVAARNPCRIRCRIIDTAIDIVNDDIANIERDDPDGRRAAIMRIEPRQQILQIWRATARASYPSRAWRWGGRSSTNSLSDAEQLLCLLLPAAELDTFALHRPNETNNDVKAALRGLGDAVTVPRLLVTQLGEFFTRYTAEDGTPIFGGGDYFISLDPQCPPSERQLGLDVVESYSASIALTLATLSFVRGFRGSVTRRDLLTELDDLDRAASIRLTAALVGLLRSFTVNVFQVDDPNGQTLLTMVNQTGAVPERVAARLRTELTDIQAGLRAVTIGSGQVQPDDSDLREPNRLFELGWSWGIVEKAPPIDFVGEYADGAIGRQREGYALDAPFLYFTVVALDGMTELFSDRTRREGLLNDVQHRLQQALRVRWDLTQNYWATLASFGGGRWPLEDIPWRATDGQESDYFTLMVSSIAARQLSATDDDSKAGLARLVRVLIELANRGRITRRPSVGDPALALYSPGVELRLEGAAEAGEPALSWVATDFAPLLLKRTVRTGRLVEDIELREQVLVLADQIWEHVRTRRISDGWGESLWDQPSNAFPGLSRVGSEAPTWHHTLRVVESMIAAADLIGSHPLRSDRLFEFAGELLNEAEHLYDQELLTTDQAAPTAVGAQLGERGRLDTIRDQLQRARDIVADRPGSATALLLDALLRLDRLAAVRQNVVEAS